MRLGLGLGLGESRVKAGPKRSYRIWKMLDDHREIQRQEQESTKVGRKVSFQLPHSIQSRRDDSKGCK